jgi:hypothetical protein
MSSNCLGSPGLFYGRKEEEETMTTLSMGRFKPTEHFNNNWAAALSAEHTIEDALKPDFWSHVGGVVKPGDTIRLIPEKNDFYALLIVMQAARGFAKVKVIDFVDLTAPTAIVSADDVISDDLPGVIEDDLEVAYKGPHLKHCVIRKSDKQILKDCISAKVEAEQWMRDHQAAMAR